MNEILIKAPAKINLFLDVIGKRSDGYHDLSMIMQMVSLFDEVHISKSESGIELKTNLGYLPIDDKNTAFKAAKLMIESFEIKSGIKIAIKKKIPVGAGLAGGSTDAAAVILGMNELFKLEQEKEYLAQLGKKVGADVPFCVIGGSAIAEGIGEKITQLPHFKDVNVILVKPDFSVSTAYVYSNFILDASRKKPNINTLAKFMECGDLFGVADNIYNVLETVTAEKYPAIEQIKTELIEYGAVGSLMSGSGPTVYGIFRDTGTAKRAYNKMREKYKLVFMAKTC